MSDPRWPLHKPVIDRERESSNPPPFVEMLAEEAAGRLASTITANLAATQFGGCMSCSRFVMYLATQMGRGNELDIGEKNRHQFHVHDSPEVFRDILRKHIVGYAAKDSTRLVRLLDWLGQFLIVEGTLIPPNYAGEGRPTATEKATFVTKVVDAINACLQHDACVFRIQTDQQFQLAARRLPSEALEKHAIQPALTLLRENAIKEALEHYENALRHFARGEDTDAVVQASHAVESTMKAVLRDKLGNDSCDTLPAAKLIERISDPSAGVLPASYQALWNNLRALLQGVPTIRNQQGGHGKAPGAADADAPTAEYAVNVAGASIVFLVRQWKTP